jgi:hypothetical protein
VGGKATWEPIRMDIFIFIPIANIAGFHWVGNPILVPIIMAKHEYEMLKPLTGKGFNLFFI